MSSATYENYQDSQHQWLGRIPTHWNCARLGSVFTQRSETVNDQDFPPLSVTMQGIVPRLATAAKTQDGDNRKKVVAGDFVINSRSDRKGSGGLSTITGSVSVISIVLVPRGVDAEFAHHLLRSVPFQEEFYRHGSGIVADLWSTRFSSMKAIALPLPPRGEQKQIADFLDRETKQIDNLIAEQEALVENLTERRKAVISHAVTKGINPDAELKDSGVEWLGRVPVGWIIDKLGRKTRIGNGSTPRREEESYWRNGTIPWLNSSCVNRNEVDSVEFYVTDQAVAECHLPLVPPGSILVGLTGQGKTRGKATLLTIESTVNQHLAYISPERESWNPRYLVAALRAAYVHLRTTSDENGSTKGGLTCNQIARTIMPIPPIQEQQNIADYLDGKTSKIDALIAEGRALIDLLKERRSALISAAVTGKIDVRSEVLTRG